MQHGATQRTTTPTRRTGNKGGVTTPTTASTNRTTTPHRSGRQNGPPATNVSVSSRVVGSRLHKTPRGDASNRIQNTINNFTSSVVAESQSTVWVAESNGNITIREKNGDIFGEVVRGANAAAVVCMLFVPGTYHSGKMWLGLSNGHVTVLDSITGERLSNDLTLHTEAVTCLTTSCGGSYVLCGSADKTVSVTDANTLVPLCRLKGSNGPIISMVTGGRYVYTTTANNGNTVMKWDIFDGQHSTLIQIEDRCAITCLMLGGRYLWCGASDGSIRIVDSTTGVMLAQSTDCHTSEVRSILQATPTHVWSAGNEIHIWDSQRFTLVSKCDVPCSGLVRVVASPEIANVWCMSGGRQGVHVLLTVEDQIPCAACAGLIHKRDAITEDLAVVVEKQKKHIEELEEKEKRQTQNYDEMCSELRKCNDLHVRLQRVVIELTQQRDEETTRSQHLEQMVESLQNTLISRQAVANTKTANTITSETQTVPSTEVVVSQTPNPLDTAMLSELSQLRHEVSTLKAQKTALESAHDALRLSLMITEGGVVGSSNNETSAGEIASLRARVHEMEDEKAHMKSLIERLTEAQRRTNMQIKKFAEMQQQSGLIATGGKKM